MDENGSREPEDYARRSLYQLLETLVEYKMDAANKAAEKLTPIERIALYALVGAREMWRLKLKIQFPIGKYKADFLVYSESGKGDKIVIECDGHDFHEKTKEQAQRDKKRDRDMQIAGYKVYRFTGSEIYRTRGQCVVDCLESSGVAV